MGGFRTRSTKAAQNLSPNPRLRAVAGQLVKMEGGIDPDALLDYAEFELFPSQNRYEVCICSGNKVETVEFGLLEQLLLYSPEVKNLDDYCSSAT